MADLQLLLKNRWNIKYLDDYIHMGTYIFILIYFAARNILKVKNMRHMLLRVLFMEATLP
jgi:hypothetical protein